MWQTLINNLVTYEKALELYLEKLLTGYSLKEPHLPIKFETVYYSALILIHDLIVIFIAVLLKLKFRDSGFVNFLIILSLSTFVVSGFIVFLGLFQILFSS